MIRECGLEDIEEMYVVINEAARAYKGVIPPDRYHEPYMPMHELREEMQLMTFFGWEEEQRLVGVMGSQPFEDVTLIRHAYVLPDFQRQGLGSKLLEHLKTLTTTPRLLVGTWADASWAIEFYEKHGFRPLANKDELLKTYWDIPERQIETSVVLGMTLSRTPQLVGGPRLQTAPRGEHPEQVRDTGTWEMRSCPFRQAVLK